MLLTVLVVPLLSGLAAFWFRHDLYRRVLLVGTALVHALLTARLWTVRPEPSLGGWLALDPIGLLFLSVISALFLAAAVYSVGYLGRERHARHIDTEEHLFFSNEPEAIFTACLLLFLAAMTLVTISQHLGLLWVGIETTTLTSAPLIYFHRHHRSLEATWKYLLICSVGIALALLGNFLMAVAASDRGETSTSLTLPALIQARVHLHRPWVAAAFLFFLVGYGTKMGLAPLHTWLPDAHSESPSLVSALLSGALLNCAFLGILRAHQICGAAGIAHFSQTLLQAFGLLSMAIAAVFILGQHDFKRMLAYSSVEHMGILALGAGLGGAGTFGMALHAVNHSLTKAGLFLVAGNILAVYGTKSVSDVRGLRRRLPVSGVLWIAGFLAITGSPPFGSFLSELTILKAALDHGQTAVAVGYLALLAVIFVGMGNLVLPMAHGIASGRGAVRARPEALWSTLPPAALASLTVLLGVYIPPPLSVVLQGVARSLGGQ
jgi:hydrogenase-4 component F